MPVSLAFLVENSLTAVIVVTYLAYEIHFGRLNRLATKLDGVIQAVIALARANENIDEEKVSERVNGESPDDLLIQDD